MDWRDMAAAEPELAAFGEQRFQSQVAYLATVRPDGGPRVHPVTPILAGGRLFVFMEPTSPKGKDLQQDARYALHSGVEGPDGGGGEFIVTGRARRVEDAHTRAMAASAASYEPAERYVLFEFSVESALSTVYPPDASPERRKYRAAADS